MHDQDEKRRGEREPHRMVLTAVGAHEHDGTADEKREVCEHAKRTELRRDRQRCRVGWLADPITFRPRELPALERLRPDPHAYEWMLSDHVDGVLDEVRPPAREPSQAVVLPGGQEHRNCQED